MQDAFTSYYETPLLLDLLDLVQALGFRAWLAPYRPNGKALHVHGFLGAVRAPRIGQRGDAAGLWPRRAWILSALIRR